MKDGPTELAVTYQSCGNCSHHNSVMRRSGLNPDYDHFCRHPEVMGSIKVLWPDSQFGERIGLTDRTPAWCPFLKPGHPAGSKEAKP